MGYVTITESVGEVMKTYHFESYDDFKDWENKISGVMVSAPEIDEEGWIKNTGRKPDFDGKTYVEVEFTMGDRYVDDINHWIWSISEADDSVVRYRLVKK